MSKPLLTVLIITIALLMPTPSPARTPHPTPLPTAVPLILIPPLGMVYDLHRRTSCIGDPLGLGGPGFFEPVTPKDGNVLIPAWQRGLCSAQPKGRRS